ncbi:TIGR03364 family FAD-dependent oxidoreductase [Microbacterium sp. YMB-B2]|uniref:TIGR03364 family FAD-dependent oxidoreductase n=1 Tax=Microbacterium tenebrionis TaxID=2830665 RepID=A0A9X1RZB8_9MICO|nr:TIGR03364 family FAD-dependent oxidoreductase [Microbacterium tenebrionis]MCC2028047.1 TIGR03364 family FAD-dependent oxidoreductase [Microbacterium tenebrionis]
MTRPPAPADSADLVVVGAGIVGLGTAYAAVRRGLRVIVVDRTEKPVGATIRNFGHLCIGAQTGLARELADIARPVWLHLAAATGFWLRESGTLIAARDADEFAVLERAADDGGVSLLSADDLRSSAPIREGAVVGGARIAADLQTNPREAAGAIIRHLAELGVEFRFRTAVTAASGTGVATTRGSISAGRVVVAVNHDVDQLLPGVAERVGVVRCALDMMRVSASMPRPLEAPLLTGWSLLRYARFAAYPETARLRERMHAERPDLAALDLNQMYTQLPDGTLILGDSHARGIQPSPFQPESAFEAFLDEARALLDLGDLRIVERWQGVYASGPDEFLMEEPEPGLHVIGATTGIGMTTGFGLAEHTIAAAYERAPQLAEEGAS